MDDPQIDTTWHDLLEDAFLDADSLRRLAVEAIRESGRSNYGQTPGQAPGDFHTASDGGPVPAGYAPDAAAQHSLPPASHTMASTIVDAYEDPPTAVFRGDPVAPIEAFLSLGDHRGVLQPPRPTTGKTRDASGGVSTSRPEGEANAPHGTFSGLGNDGLPQLGQAIVGAVGDMDGAAGVAGASAGAREPADRGARPGSHHPPQLSPSKQTRASVTGGRSLPRGSTERTIDDFNPSHDDIALSRKHPKRPRLSSEARNADRPVAKQPLATHPVPVPVPVTTTVRNTEIIEWAGPHTPATPATPLSPIPELAAAANTGSAAANLTHTPMPSTTGQAVAAGGIVASPTPASVSSTEQNGATTVARPEEVEATPLLRSIAARAQAQMHSRIANQGSKLLPESQKPPPPRRFEAPRIQYPLQQAPATNRRSWDMYPWDWYSWGRHSWDRHSWEQFRYYNDPWKGKSMSFSEGPNAAPLVTPSVKREAHLTEFNFRIEIGASLPRLETIRLLKMVWSPVILEKRDAPNADEIPEYTLQDFRCSDRPKYMALSYVWGEETPTSAISINGKVVQVRSNLAQALWSISHFDPETPVWADAICINQEDAREKSSMVQDHMAQIFANALLVYAWLGPVRNSSTKDLFTHFSDLGKLFTHHVGSTDVSKLNERSLDVETILARNIDQLFVRFKHPPGKWGAFPTEEYSSFSTRPFWSRIWVLQEVYLAKRLYYACGNCHLASNSLAGALLLLEAFQRHLVHTRALVPERSAPAPDESDELLRKFALGFPSFPGMHRLIVYTSIYPIDVVSLRIAMTNFCVKELPAGSKATDPRDMIYGLMGFCNVWERDYIRVDYSKSVQETYINVTRALIRNGFTDILSWAQSDTKRIGGLPSWVPDYSSTIYESLCSQGQTKPWLPRFKACNEAKYSDHENIHPFDPFALPVHGRRLDRVWKAGARWFPRSSAGSAPSSTRTAVLLARSITYEDLIFFLDDVQKFVIEARLMYKHLVDTNLARYVMRPAPNDDAVWRVPCCDQIVIDGRPVRGCPSTKSRFEATKAHLKAYRQDPKAELPAESRPYLESLSRWADKRPFLTEQGFVGLGPANMMPGDTVVVLDGFHACYLARHQDTPRPSYRLIGEAYVDGFMDGEIRDSVRASPEWFELL